MIALRHRVTRKQLGASGTLRAQVEAENARDGAWWLGMLGFALAGVAGYLLGCDDMERCPVCEGPSTHVCESCR